MIPSGLMDRVRRMQSDMERSFNEFFRGEGGGTQGMMLASADMYETDDEIIAKFDIPGVDKDNIDVQVSNDVLEVKAEKKEEREVEKEGAFMSERAYRGYYRQVPLPPYTRNEGVRAEYKDGTLTVRVPKDQERVKKNKVPVD